MAKVAVINKRLFNENRGIRNLSKCSDVELKKAASKYQIGTNIKRRVPVEIMQGGRLVTTKRDQIVPKTRGILEKEIRDRLTVTYEVPRELWTEEQQEGWEVNQVETMKTIEEIQPIKEELGIRIVLPPYEDGLSRREEALRIAEVEEVVWDDMYNSWNHYYKREEDADGIAINKKVGRQIFAILDEDKPEDKEEEKVEDAETKSNKK